METTDGWALGLLGMVLLISITGICSIFIAERRSRRASLNPELGELYKIGVDSDQIETRAVEGKLYLTLMGFILAVVIISQLLNITTLPNLSRLLIGCVVFVIFAVLLWFTLVRKGT